MEEQNSKGEQNLQDPWSFKQKNAEPDPGNELESPSLEETISSDFDTQIPSLEETISTEIVTKRTTQTKQKLPLIRKSKATKRLTNTKFVLQCIAFFLSIYILRILFLIVQ